MSKRQHRFDDDFDHYEPAGKTRRGDGERRGGREFDHAIKHMDPYALDDLLEGEEPEDDFDLRFQNRSR